MTSKITKENKIDKKGLFKGSWTWKEILIVGVCLVIVIGLGVTVAYFVVGGTEIIPTVIETGLVRCFGI